MRFVFLLPLAALIGCSSDDSGPACTTNCPGAPGAPTFGGVSSVAPAHDKGSLRISWTAATDDSPSEQLRYRVYASPLAGRALQRAAVFTTEPGATSAVLSVSPADKPHYIVVRAVDPTDKEDANVLEKSATAVGDTTPPSFAGVKTVVPASNGGVTVSWNAATDDLTPPEGIRYAILGGKNTIDSSRPLAVVEGKVQAVLSSLGAGGDTWKFAVRAIDAGNNVDTNTATIASALGPDAEAPVFGGCQTVMPRGSKTATVTWQAATDDSTPASAIAYDIYVATAPGAQAFAAPPAFSVTGATTAVLPNLLPSTNYNIVCRARDAAGNRDANMVEKTVRTTDNTVAPTFAGLVSHDLDPTLRTVRLTWAAATDDVTPADQIVYEVFQRSATGTFDFLAPIAVSMPAATEITVANLPSAAELVWVVRARDADFNLDGNTVERTGTTFVSFQNDVTPIFVKNCAVVGCHTSAFPVGGMSLSAWTAYDSLVNKPAGQRPGGITLNRITPFNTADSYLFRKISGTGIVGAKMPAPQTGNTLLPSEVQTIQDWILQGAPRN
jgi:hypothetical protein